MTNNDKLDRLHQRLLSEQRHMILAAADVDALPSSAVLARMADLELAISAVEAAIEDSSEAKP